MDIHMLLQLVGCHEHHMTYGTLSVLPSHHQHHIRHILNLSGPRLRGQEVLTPHQGSHLLLHSDQSSLLHDHLFRTRNWTCCSCRWHCFCWRDSRCSHNWSRCLSYCPMSDGQDLSPDPLPHPHWISPPVLHLQCLLDTCIWTSYSTTSKSPTHISLGPHLHTLKCKVSQLTSKSTIQGDLQHDQFSYINKATWPARWPTLTSSRVMTPTVVDDAHICICQREAMPYLILL